MMDGSFWKSLFLLLDSLEVSLTSCQYWCRPSIMIITTATATAVAAPFGFAEFLLWLNFVGAAIIAAVAAAAANNCVPIGHPWFELSRHATSKESSFFVEAREQERELCC